MSSQITQGILLMKDPYIHVLQNCICFIFKYPALDLCLGRKAHKDTRNLLVRAKPYGAGTEPSKHCKPCLQVFSTEQQSGKEKHL